MPEEQIQKAKVYYVDELGKNCIEFVCDYCGKTIIKPLIYIRDDRINNLQFGTELIVLHDCKSEFVWKTLVFAKG